MIIIGFLIGITPIFWNAVQISTHNEPFKERDTGEVVVLSNINHLQTVSLANVFESTGRYRPADGSLRQYQNVLNDVSGLPFIPLVAIGGLLLLLVSRATQEATRRSHSPNFALLIQRISPSTFTSSTRTESSSLKLSDSVSSPSGKHKTSSINGCGMSTGRLCRKARAKIPKVLGYSSKTRAQPAKTSVRSWRRKTKRSSLSLQTSLTPMPTSVFSKNTSQAPLRKRLSTSRP